MEFCSQFSFLSTNMILLEEKTLDSSFAEGHCQTREKFKRIEQLIFERVSTLPTVVRRDLAERIEDTETQKSEQWDKRFADKLLLSNKCTQFEDTFQERKQHWRQV